MSTDDDLSFDVTPRVRDGCLCLHVRRAARAVTRLYDEALRPVDLTSGQFSLMMSLNRPKPPTMSQVSAVLAMDRTTLTANLKPIERRGLIAVTVDEIDKRSRRLALTSAGRQALAAALPLWEQAQQTAERLLDGADPERLRADLRSLS